MIQLNSICQVLSTRKCVQMKSSTHIPESGPSRGLLHSSYTVLSRLLFLFISIKGCPSPLLQLKTIFPDHSSDHLRRALYAYDIDTELAVQALLDNLIEVNMSSATSNFKRGLYSSLPSQNVKLLLAVSLQIQL